MVKYLVVKYLNAARGVADAWLDYILSTVRTNTAMTVECLDAAREVSAARSGHIWGFFQRASDEGLQAIKLLFHWTFHVAGSWSVAREFLKTTITMVAFIAINLWLIAMLLKVASKFLKIVYGMAGKWMDSQSA